MEKPTWRVRSSSYVVESPYMRLRSDELELPDGTIVPDYYVRESPGFTIAFALTPEERVVLVRQYRYGSDALHYEPPAGTLDDCEDPSDCARRELLEETGYEAESWEDAGYYFAEPSRSNARAHLYLARGARKVAEPQLEPTEALEIEEVTLDGLHAMLRDGRIDSGHAIAACYRALDRLGRLAFR